MGNNDDIELDNNIQSEEQTGNHRKIILTLLITAVVLIICIIVSLLTYDNKAEDNTNIKDTNKEQNKTTADKVEDVYDFQSITPQNVENFTNILEYETGIPIEEYIKTHYPEPNNIMRIIPLMWNLYGYNPRLYTGTQDGDCTITQNDNFLEIINNKTKFSEKIDLDKFVIGVSTPERIKIYSMLQHSPLILLEYLTSNVKFITTADYKDNNSSFYDGTGLYLYNPKTNGFYLAYNTAKALSKFYKYSEELKEEPYKSEIKALYDTGLLGEYAEGKSEDEIYAYAVTYILGYTGTEEFFKHFESTIPKVLLYVNKTMSAGRLPSEKNKIALARETLTNYSIPLYQCKKGTGMLIPTNANFQDIRVDIVNKGNKSATCTIKTIDDYGNMSIIKTTDYEIPKMKIITEEYTNEPCYYREYNDNKLVKQRITNKEDSIVYEYKYDENGNRTKNILYSKNGEYLEEKE